MWPQLVVQWTNIVHVVGGGGEVGVNLEMATDVVELVCAVEPPTAASINANDPVDTADENDAAVEPPTAASIDAVDGAG